MRSPPPGANSRRRTAGEFIPLGEFRQSSAKIVSVWAVEGEFDVTKLTSNTFALEWPPKSGKNVEFPDVNRAVS